MDYVSLMMLHYASRCRYFTCHVRWMDNDDSNDDTHNMGISMGEDFMWVYPMMLMVTHTTRCSYSVL
jgi:hypothetical protein